MINQIGINWYDQQIDDFNDDSAVYRSWKYWPGPSVEKILLLEQEFIAE